jgi:hypothetical protein
MTRAFASKTGRRSLIAAAIAQQVVSSAETDLGCCPHPSASLAARILAASRERMIYDPLSREHPWRRGTAARRRSPSVY